MSFFRGLKLIHLLGSSDEWDVLVRTINKMDEIRINKVVQLAATLEAQTQQNRDFMTIKQDIIDIKTNVDVIANYLVTHHGNKWNEK